MNYPFEVFEPHWGPHGPIPPPPRPRHTAHPYQGARTKRAFAAQRQLNIDGVVRTPVALSNPDQDILSKHILELRRMFPPRPADPLGPAMAPVVIYEESIEDPAFIIDFIKTAHKQRVAEMRLHPKRKRAPKKKIGGRRVPQRAASVDAMDVDRDDIAIHRPSFPRAAQSLSDLSFLPVPVPRTPTARRPVPEDDDDDDDEFAAAEFERQYRITLKKAQQMQV